MFTHGGRSLVWSRTSALGLTNFLLFCCFVSFVVSFIFVFLLVCSSMENCILGISAGLLFLVSIRVHILGICILVVSFWFLLYHYDDIVTYKYGAVLLSFKL
jgi:hypothetical protein